MNENIFDKLDFGPLKSLLDNDDITDISFDNNGQIWIRSLTQGSLRVEVNGATPEFVEKLAFQCSNVMGTTFNNAKPFLDAESAELRLNFVHPSIATNGIAMVIRKTPAKIRLEKEKLIKEDYFTQDIHDILIKCVEGHCNIIVAGETGSGKTEFVKYLASHTKVNEKIITIEDTLELHLDRIFPQRDIVAMKTNNVASYTDVLVTCMRQNPKWILLSEVRSAEAVSAVRNSISSGHNILSTIHADKASAIPYRLYSLMETDIDVEQFLSTIYRYVQLGVHIRAYYNKELGRFHREVDEVVEFYVDDDNKPQSRTIYQKTFGNEPVLRKPSDHLIEYLENQNIDISDITNKIAVEEHFDYDENVGETEEYQDSQEVVYEETSDENQMEPQIENQEETTDGEEHIQFFNQNYEETAYDSNEEQPIAPQFEEYSSDQTTEENSTETNNETYVEEQAVENISSEIPLVPVPPIENFEPQVSEIVEIPQPLVHLPQQPVQQQAQVAQVTQPIQQQIQPVPQVQPPMQPLPNTMPMQPLPSAMPMQQPVAFQQLPQQQPIGMPQGVILPFTPPNNGQPPSV